MSHAITHSRAMRRGRTLRAPSALAVDTLGGQSQLLGQRAHVRPTGRHGVVVTARARSTTQDEMVATTRPTTTTPPAIRNTAATAARAR